MNERKEHIVLMLQKLYKSSLVNFLIYVDEIQSYE